MSKKTFIEKIKSIGLLTLGGATVYQIVYFKKDFDRYYRNVLQPLVKHLDPETTHKLGVFGTKYGIFPASKYVDPPVLKTDFLHFNLSNPLGIAAGFDKHAEAVLGLHKLGFSIVEIGSVTPEPQEGNPKPRVFRLLADSAVINRYGFNSEGHQVVFERLKNLGSNDNFNGLLGVNLGKNKTSDHPVKDYVIGIEKFGEVADYFVINISSPNTPGLRSMQKKDVLKELLSSVKEARDSLPNNKRPPLLLKLAPDLSKEEKLDIVDILNKKECKVEGLIISNTTIDRPSHLKSTEVANEAGGLSGKPLKDKSTEMIREMYKLTQGKIPIIGVGGVFSGHDAYEKILAGASAIQIYTAFIYHGPPVVGKIKGELAELLTKDGYANVNEAVGKGVK